MRKLTIILAGLTALGLGAVGTVWWHQTTRPEYLLVRGQEAILRGNLKDARALAARLEAGGHLDHAHLLRGHVLLRLGGVGRDSEHLSAEDQLYCQQALQEFNQIKEKGAL